MNTTKLYKDRDASLVALQGDVKALILDDSRFDRTRVRRLFRSVGVPFNLDEADTVDSLKKVLDQETFDVILVDYNLPVSNGLEALKMVREHPKNANAATIMIAGDDQTEVAVQAMKFGCKDYISKRQLSAERLKSSIFAAIDEARLEHIDGHRRIHQIEELTKQVMSKYSTAFQPQIARIVRDIRALKVTLADPNSNLPADIEAIEQRCISLWAHLIEPKGLDAVKFAQDRM
ncbi:hypothetical protein A9Q95_11235 [Rhodobacterales bacterium 59_46_T64]|nr:hypothetical protein A9Q95_11235 [Rhodobacterales bacterium 59_46_T64]